MGEEQMMKLMKEFVALVPGEVPGFDTPGGVVERANTRWGASIRLLQGLSRKGQENEKDGHEAHIRIWTSLLPDRNAAYQIAVLYTTTQRAPIGEPGMPEGSWSGLPIGEKVWSRVPQSGEAPVADLTVWDERLAIHVSVEYHFVSRWVKSVPISQSDLELGEMVARLILAKANLALLGWRDSPKWRLVVNGAPLEARRVQEKSILVPLKAVVERLGGKIDKKAGVVYCSWRGQKVAFPLGARVVLVGGRKVPLSLPILYDGHEAWVDGEELARALQLEVQKKGQTIALRGR